MHAIIITIGDELIDGFRIDTNSLWLSRKLSHIGIDVSSVIKVRDNIGEIITALNSVLKSNANYVFITGGLGPTNDDLTLESISSFLGSDIIFNDSYYRDLKKKFLIKKSKLSKIHKKQAMIIKGVEPIKNNIGTAQGGAFSKNNIKFYFYPGVPIEFKSMVIDHFFKKNNHSRIKKESVILNTFGVSESQLYEKLENIINDNKNQIKISFLPNEAGVTIKAVKTSEKCNFNSVKEKIIKKINKNCFSQGDIKIEEVVSNLLIKNNLTISTAESCTGGAIGKVLSSLPNSSKYYNGGIIAYSNELKESLLKISKNKLKKYGPVSKEIAIDMAKNAASIIKTDIAISSTGYAGPNGGDRYNSNGTIYIAIRIFEETYYKKYLFTPDRKLHRERSTCSALNMLRLLLIEKEG